MDFGIKLLTFINAKDLWLGMFGDELAVVATIMLQPLNLFDRIVANLFVFFGIGAILVYAYGAQIQD